MKSDEFAGISKKKKKLRVSTIAWRRTVTLIDMS
jgi:hypothetical protein